MPQETFMDILELERLIIVAKTFNRPVQIDWVNRHLRVLSVIKTDPNKIMSNGKPMTWQDVLAQAGPVGTK